MGINLIEERVHEVISSIPTTTIQKGTLEVNWWYLGGGVGSIEGLTQSW